MRIINDWLQYNQPLLNITKTIYINYANGLFMGPKNPKLIFEGTEILNVRNTKYLS